MGRDVDRQPLVVPAGEQRHQGQMTEADRRELGQTWTSDRIRICSICTGAASWPKSWAGSRPDLLRTVAAPAYSLIGGSQMPISPDSERSCKADIAVRLTLRR